MCRRLHSCKHCLYGHTVCRSCGYSCTITKRHRSLKCTGYCNVNISILMGLAFAVFICHYNFCRGDLPLFRTFSGKYFCHKAEMCTSMKCSKSSSRLPCFWLTGEEGQHSGVQGSVPNSREGVPEQQADASLFLNFKLDTFSHISSSLVPSFIISTSNSFSEVYLPFLSVFPCVLIL